MAKKKNGAAHKQKQKGLISSVKKIWHALMHQIVQNDLTTKHKITSRIAGVEMDRSVEIPRIIEWIQFNVDSKLAIEFYRYCYFDADTCQWLETNWNYNSHNIYDYDPRDFTDILNRTVLVHPYIGKDDVRNKIWQRRLM